MHLPHHRLIEPRKNINTVLFCCSFPYFSISETHSRIVISVYFIQVYFESKAKIKNESVQTKIALIFKGKDKSNWTYVDRLISAPMHIRNLDYVWTIVIRKRSNSLLFTPKYNEDKLRAGVSRAGRGIPPPQYFPPRDTCSLRVKMSHATTADFVLT
jgi:hypothetical protein